MDFNGGAPPPAKRPRNDLSDPEDRSSNSSHEHPTPAMQERGSGKQNKKPPLSCAECRRLKLKCDRVFPCRSCTKRGCGEICPDGALTSGKGSRFILANTEQLHTKIIEMSDRIRHLEEALDAMQRSHSTEQHPLLRSDLLLVKNTVQLYGDTGSINFGTQNHVDDDRGVARSKSLRTDKPLDSRIAPGGIKGLAETFSQNADSWTSSETPPPDLPDDISKLSMGFPIPLAIAPSQDLHLRQRLRDSLPSQQRSQYLFEQARENAFWMYNPHPSETFFPNLLRHIYTVPLENLCSRRLGLLFMILAIGSLVDLRQPPDSPDGEKYHHLARASLTEVPVMESTSVETVIALFYMTWYLLVFSDKKRGVAHAWAMLGLTVKLAQSIGLHRDTSGVKSIPEEDEKRRALFWELLHLDARLALSLGRPASLFLQHSDCKRPSYTPEPGYDASESMHHYQQWKHSSYISYLSPVLELVTSPAPDYATVIQVDRRIRMAPIPSILQSTGPLSSRHPRYLVMQQATLSSAIESVFLQLHRSFFFRVLNGPEALNARNEYSPSIVAVFRSSVRLISIVETLSSKEPDMVLRFLSFYANAFSAAVCLCLLVTRAPFISLCPMALMELERTIRLFEYAKDRSRRPFEVLPILRSMISKARKSYTQWITREFRPQNLIYRPENCDEDAPGFSSDHCNPGMQGDAFEHAHPDLIETVKEARQRGESYKASVTTYEACSPSMGETSTDLATSTVNASYRVPVVDNLNFDFGAFNTNWKDESWMSWF